MESSYGGRNKKLIWALEAGERLGRPNCATCNDRLQKQRGCKKPGYNIEGTMVWRFTSPKLKEADQVLRECPVGAILRDAPWAYDAIYAQDLSEKSGLDVLTQPRWLQSTIYAVAIERQRLREMAERDRQMSRDAEYGKRVVRGG